MDQFFLKTLLLFGFINVSFGQFCSDAFNKSIYQNNVQKNIVYGSADNFLGIERTLKLNLYTPLGDDLEHKPVMIWIHGGSFIAGDKDDQIIDELCDSMSRKGYVAVSLGYRLGTSGTASSFERAVYRSVQDARAATRYLIENQDLYGIDTSAIFIGGFSAGAIAAIQAAYLDEDERPASTFGSLTSRDLGCLDCSGNTLQHPINYKAVISLWGAMGDSSWRGSDDVTPILLYHGTDDQVLPIDKGSPFGVGLFPEVHGSLPIINQSNKLNLPVDGRIMPGQDHTPWGGLNGDFSIASPRDQFWWDSICKGVFEYTYSHLKPQITILGDTTANSVNTFTYDLSNIPFNAEWNVTGGTLVSSSNHKAEIKWGSANKGTIEVRAKNKFGICAETRYLEVRIIHETKVYPNPLETNITLETPWNQTALHVLNSAGELIQEIDQLTTLEQMETSNWSSGTYFFHFTSIETGQKETIKTIKL